MYTIITCCCVLYCNSTLSNSYFEMFLWRKQWIQILVWFLPYEILQTDCLLQRVFLLPISYMSGYFSLPFTCDRGELGFIIIIIIIPTEAFGSRAIIVFLLNKMTEHCRLEVLHLPDLILCRIPMTQSVAFCEVITWLMCDHFLTRHFICD